MLADVLLVAEKELKEVLLRQGGWKANAIFGGLILLVFGIVIPVQAGRMWVQFPIYVLSWVWLPLLLVSALVADSFAGERERHTLETLLSSRLSDRAILLGKVGAAVGYAYGILLLLMVTSLVSVNVAHGTMRYPLLWSTPVTLSILGFGALVTVLIATIGVSVSLRSETVRQASQRLSLGLIAVITLPGMIAGMVGRALPPAIRDSVIEWLAVLDGRVVALAVAGLLLALDALFLAQAVHRFRRSRLVFD